MPYLEKIYLTSGKIEIEKIKTAASDKAIIQRVRIHLHLRNYTRHQQLYKAWMTFVTTPQISKSSYCVILISE